MFSEVKADCPIEARIYEQYLAAASKRFADDMPECAGWFLISVPPKQELKMGERLGRGRVIGEDENGEPILLQGAGLDVWVPETTEETIRWAKRKNKGRKRKPLKEHKRELILNGYVLVRFVPSREAWHAINQIEGVQAICAREGSFEAPTLDQRLESALTPKAIKRLQELEIEIQSDEFESRLTAGQHVKITNGPFTGLLGEVTKCEWGIVHVEVDIFGRATPTTLDETEVVPV